MANAPHARPQTRRSLVTDQFQRRITARSLIVGAVSIALLSLVNPYLQFMLKSWWIAGVGSLLTGPILTLFLLLAVNSLLTWLWPGRAFRRTELLVVYGMGMVSLGFLGHGGLAYMVSHIAYPSYMATPANDWQNTILPYIPTWLAPSTLQASYWFWEGVPRASDIPWDAWFSPALYWSLFTIALFAGMYCLGCLLSRDWIEHQRLTYPLVDVPLSLTGDADRPTLGTSILHNRIFWLGFAIPAFVGMLGWLHGFYPNVPKLSVEEVHIGKPFVGMGLPWSVLGETHLSLYYNMIGVMCLIPSEISLSLWLFYALYKVQLLTWATLGFMDGSRTVSSFQPRMFIGFTEVGGYLALSLVMLWQSRVAIRRALWSLLGRPDGADAYEPLGGRGTVIGFGLAMLAMLWFGMKAGMSWWSLLLLIGIFYGCCISASRLVAGGGVVFIAWDRAPRPVIVDLLGARPLGSSTLIMYAYMNGIYMDDPYNLAMPQMMNSFKLVRREKMSGRAFTAAALLAVAVMLAVGVPAMLRMIYMNGGTKLDDWPFSSWPRQQFGAVDASLRLPEIPNNWHRLAIAVGSCIMLGLSWLQLNVVGWPVSPVGFIMASTWAMDNVLWSAALIGWLVVFLIKRLGGLLLYRRLRPAFLGLIIGDYLAGGFWSLLGTITAYLRLTH
jgi:hypothetical protein